MTSIDHLPNEITKHRVLNSSQASQFWGVSLPHWRRLYRCGKVPKPIRIGDRKLGWRVSDLTEALTQRANGTA